MHELRNHLAIILGFVEIILAETRPDHPRYEDLVEVRQAAVEAAKLIGMPPA
jgi:hypothetical protein